MQLLYLLASLASASPAGPQSGWTPTPLVEFSSVPKDLQLYPRDAMDRATVSVAGTSFTPFYKKARVTALRDGVPYAESTQALSYSGGQAAFNIATPIDAGLYDYDFTVSLGAGSTWVLVRQASDVVCGDVYLVDGQSNALAADYHMEENADAQWQSPWLRSFGTNVIGPAAVEADLAWDLATAEPPCFAYNGHAMIGSWALRMGHQLVEDHAMPIAILNGAVGWTTIDYHLRNDEDHDDTDTCYGRLLFRAQQAGVAAAAKAIFWYQGETDAENGTSLASYLTSFIDLYDAWIEDYPGLEKIYIFQYRSTYPETYPLRELQRIIPDYFPGVEVMSTTAVPCHSGVHYYLAGYEAIGAAIERLVARDFYGSTVLNDIEPPNILSARYTTSASNQILITLRDPDDTLIFEGGAEAGFSLSDGITVTIGHAMGPNTILLDLAGPSAATAITYPGAAGTAVLPCVDYPWVTNGNGVGLLTFFDFPIDAYVP